MKDIFVKLKPLLLLFSMTLISIGVVWVTNQFKDTSVTQVEGVVSHETPILVQEEETILDTSEVLAVEEEIKEEYVLAASSTNQCRSQDFTYIESHSVCRRGHPGSEVHFFKDIFGMFFSQGSVSTTSKVFVTEVTVPLELFSGIEVKDSNALITRETPTIKAAGEQFKETSANVLRPPQENLSGWDSNSPFKFDAATAVGEPGSERDSESYQIGVEETLPNECPECSDYNANPDKSNTIAEFKLNALYRAPGELDSLLEHDVQEFCPITDNYVPWDSDEYTACKLNIIDRALEFVKSIPDWASDFKCQTIFNNNDPDCVKVEDIVVIMYSPFGSDSDCARGTACTNAYMNRRNSVALPPSSNMGGKTYVLTPCEAIIQGRTYKVSCAWDLSHLFKERKVNEYDDFPGVDSTPSDREYEEFLLEVKGTRGTAVAM